MVAREKSRDLESGASHPGYARPLERQAGKADLRTCWLGTRDSPPLTISTITGRRRPNPDRNTIGDRNPSGDKMC